MKKANEFDGYIDKNGFAQGFEYKAIIELKGEWTTEETTDFISKSFTSDSILGVDGPKARILWEMPGWGDEEDLGMILYYLLEDSKLGSYKYYRVN